VHGVATASTEKETTQITKKIKHMWKVIIMESTSAELATAVILGKLGGCHHSLVRRHQQAW
jgi:hypothetical protein